jgi:hypothetical protein
LRKTKNKKKKKMENKTYRTAVGCLKPPFQLAVVASQPAANHTGPATVANLSPVQTAVGTNRPLWRR